MEISNILGTIGVTLLLLAYFLHLRNIISHTGIFYIALNFSGAVIACISSLLLQFYPFVVLEGIWAIVSLMPLWNKKKIIS
ncbi:MAG: hypothetical protein KBF42_02960 [Chitinophagales bacterium]|jgi:hypothetical protein|nr:hypothetical protein [Bacteroidota bacterium]MBP8915787.1 hypothetical protein [Chitinophagales bacterium]MBP9220317.1 hypothetical protein [Chitinophagales bacterium]MBP9795439.1 hypothetical protein [Chitinophagales bacterium]